MISAKEAREMADGYSVLREEVIEIIGDAIEKRARRGESKVDILLTHNMDQKCVDILTERLNNLGYDFNFTMHGAPDRPANRFIIPQPDINHILHIRW